MRTRFLFSLAVVVFILKVPLSTQAQETVKTPLRIGLYQDTGVSSSSEKLLKTIAALPEFKVDLLKAKDFQAGSLEVYQVVMFPGGTGGGQAKALGEQGRAKIREYVEKGGGYVGICAGAYLATNDYSWSLGILNAKVVDKKHWARGYGDVEMTLSPKAQTIFGRPVDRLKIYYHQGPLLTPGDDPKLPPYEKLASFETEIAKNGAPPGIMKGTTAIGMSTFGKGRVICFSPHPELTEGLGDFVHRAVFWASGNDPK